MLSSNPLQRMQKRLSEMDTALNVSFSNIKRDLSKQTDLLEKLRSMVSEQDKQIRHLAGEVARLQKQIQDNPTPSAELSPQKEKVLNERSAEPTERSETIQRKPKGFTALHLQILKRLMLLQMENGKRAVSMRELAADVYPAKEYNIIKATLSEYIKRLHQHGLIEKLNADKLYLSYTENALQYADSQRLSRMKELISKPLGVR